MTDNPEVDAMYISEPVVKLIAQNGSDDMVLAAMLVSTEGEASQHYLLDNPNDHEEKQAGRINFLMKNRHGSPFEHNQFVFFVQAGIFVFREFHRHRIGWSYNEESGRYTQLKPKFYIPAQERPLKQVGKPGAYTMEPAPELHPKVTYELCASYNRSYEAYQRLLVMGVAKEVARMCLPVGIVSSMYATCNARSLMSFLSLRTFEEDATFPSKPQYEIEQVARELEKHFAAQMPITYEAWNRNGRVAP